MPALLYDETIGAFKEAAPPMVWDDGWQYDEGTDEAALLNNLKKPQLETLGKIYYIQAYINGSVTQNVPYMVIDVNHDDTTGTMDLMSKVVAINLAWHNNTSSWIYGKYSTSTVYSWLANTCINGYSSNIQAKMCYMSERWREATGIGSGTLQTRSTKCKILNPFELCGTAASQVDSTYGSLYPVWTNSVAALTNRCVFYDTAMSSPRYYWTNSWDYFDSDIDYTWCWAVYTDGSLNVLNNGQGIGVAPVIRLSSNPS